MHTACGKIRIMRSAKNTQHSTGFTIVELLIVIVVIGILAAISVVAYNGVQDRANDVAVKSDLTSIAKQFDLFRAVNGRYPYGTTELTNMRLKVAKTAYGNGFSSSQHNLLYCRVAVGSEPNAFALVASSKSGTVFTYTSMGNTTTSANAWSHTASMNICINAGIPQAESADRDIFYLYNAWQYGV